MTCFYLINIKLILLIRYFVQIQRYVCIIYIYHLPLYFNKFVLYVMLSCKGLQKYKPFYLSYV